MDRAGHTYWDDVWKDAPLGRSINPTGTGRQNYVVRKFHDLYRRHLSSIPAGARLIEVGCANSSWLPYFARTYGFQVAGLDYSEVGCLQSERVLKEEGISGEIVHGDLFSPPDQLLKSFDVAVSQGLVEHFEETTTPVRAIAALLRPRGLVVTIIPNLAGVLGRIQKVINKPVYDVHVPLTAVELADAHRQAGLGIVASGYLVPVNFGVCNLAGLNGSRRKVASEVVRTLIRLSYIPWAIDERRPLPATQGFSGYAYCVAAKG